MQTIILPGYFVGNRKWAKEVKNNLNLPQVVLLHEWRHWTQGDLSINYEVEVILEEITGKRTNIIAKSVGTEITMHIIPMAMDWIGKVILCGIPTPGTKEGVRNLFQKGLSLLKPDKMICFQNTGDPFASYKQIKAFLGEIAPKIQVIEKPRSDHDYPYYEDFRSFLTARNVEGLI